jgi:DNA-binding response OmpR family regulator
VSDKVLVVDDEAQVGELFTELLKKEKCAVKCVTSGEEALEIINKEDFAVVLLDIKLPGISGIETLEKIRAIKPNQIVIMITGFGYDEELIAKSKELGCSGYISKNMPIRDIVDNFRLFAKTAKKKAEEK